MTTGILATPEKPANKSSSLSGGFRVCVSFRDVLGVGELRGAGSALAQGPREEVSAEVVLARAPAQP